jgi:hypothetical protein
VATTYAEAGRFHRAVRSFGNGRVGAALFADRAGDREIQAVVLVRRP